MAFNADNLSVIPGGEGTGGLAIYLADATADTDATIFTNTFWAKASETTLENRQDQIAKESLRTMVRNLGNQGRGGLPDSAGGLPLLIISGTGQLRMATLYVAGDEVGIRASNSGATRLTS